MSADKPTAEKDDPNINGASWLELTEENLNAHKARMATLQGQKHEAKHEICNVTKKIISNAKKGESLTTSTCIHPEFIEHFEKKGFIIENLSMGIGTIIKW